MSRIHLSPPDVGPAERQALLDAFDSGWVAPVGPDLDAFEAEVAARVGVGHAAALSSGTAALQLALLLAGVGPGDEVLVPTFTFVATASAVTHVGARPVFVDSEPHSWNVDPSLVVEELEGRARSGRLPAAVITVDLYGQCADHDPIIDACRRFEVPLIEDAAEALGATYRGRQAGSLGDLGVFSFNGNKLVTTSGGGMLVSDDGERIERARHLATQAREPAPHYEHREVGFNHRLSNLLAALGRAQLARLDEMIARRRDHHGAYRRAVEPLEGIELMPIAPWGEPNWWLTCLTIHAERFGASREDVRRHLETLDIESRPTWKPLHLQKAFAGCDLVGGGVAEGVFETGLCLPTGSAMTDGDRARVIDGLVGSERATGRA